MGGTGGSYSWVGPAMNMFGTMTSASSARQSGSDARNIYNLNAEEKLKEGRIAKQRSGLEQNRYRKSSRRFMGEQKAKLAAQGVDINQGSALEVLADMAGDAELDALLIGYEGDLESDAAKHDANMMRYQGAVAEREGKSKSTSLLIRGAGNMLEDLPKYDYRKKKTTSYTTRQGRESGQWH